MYKERSHYVRRLLPGTFVWSLDQDFFGAKYFFFTNSSLALWGICMKFGTQRKVTQVLQVECCPQYFMELWPLNWDFYSNDLSLQLFWNAWEDCMFNESSTKTRGFCLSIVEGVMTLWVWFVCIFFNAIDFSMWSTCWSTCNNNTCGHIIYRFSCALLFNR
jgi:hypothetical protein